MVIVGAGVVIVAIAALGVQAVRGNRTVSVQRDAHTIHDAALDDAFYNCIDVQAHSLVSPDEPVLLVANLGDLVTLLADGNGAFAKAVGLEMGDDRRP